MINATQKAVPTAVASVQIAIQRMIPSRTTPSINRVNLICLVPIASYRLTCATGVHSMIGAMLLEAGMVALMERIAMQTIAVRDHNQIPSRVVCFQISDLCR